MNKKLLTFAAITSMSLASTAILHADNNSAKKDKAEHRQMKADKFAGLNLTPEQSLQIASIDKSYKPQYMSLKEQIKAIKKQYKSLDANSSDYAQQSAALDIEKESLMTEKSRLKEQHHAEVMAVLTPEQQAQAMQNKSEK